MCSLAVGSVSSSACVNRRCLRCTIWAAALRTASSWRCAAASMGLSVCLVRCRCRACVTAPFMVASLTRGSRNRCSVAWCAWLWVGCPSIGKSQDLLELHEFSDDSGVGDEHMYDVPSSSNTQKRRSKEVKVLKVLPWVDVGAGGLGAGKTSGAGTRGVSLDVVIGVGTGYTNTNGGESSDNRSKVHADCGPAENPSL